MGSSENQYKRKFNEWYSKGMLPRKKRRKIVQQAMTGEDERDLELESEPGVASTRALGYTVRAVAEDSIGDTGDLRGLFGEDPQSQLVRHTSSSGTANPNPETGLEPTKISSAQHTQQHQFKQLLADLWDAYFDVGFEGDAEVTVADAVRAMGEFIIEESAKPDLSAVTDCAGDVDLMRIVSGLLCPEFPNQVQRLQTLLPDHDARPYCSDYTGLSPPNMLYRDPLIYCCECGLGPYNPELFVGCVMYNCNDHEFCDKCIKE